MGNHSLKKFFGLLACFISSKATKTQQSINKHYEEKKWLVKENPILVYFPNLLW